jgi:hypothetical protein
LRDFSEKEREKSCRRQSKNKAGTGEIYKGKEVLKQMKG